MIDVDFQDGPPASALVRSFAACLASVTETPLGMLPMPADLHHRRCPVSWQPAL